MKFINLIKTFDELFAPFRSGKDMESVQAPRIKVTLEDEHRLLRELERLKRKLNMGYELTLKWLPGQSEKVCGEVKGKCIYIYEEDEKSALATLKHEFFDYILSKIIEPYEKVANKLIGLINEQTYKRKEELVEALTKLI